MRRTRIFLANFIQQNKTPSLTGDRTPGGAAVEEDRVPGRHHSALRGLGEPEGVRREEPGLGRAHPGRVLRVHHLRHLQAQAGAGEKDERHYSGSHIGEHYPFILCSFYSDGRTNDINPSRQASLEALPQPN